jgi:hypothetical protein
MGGAKRAFSGSALRGAPVGGNDERLTIPCRVFAQRHMNRLGTAFVTALAREIAFLKAQLGQYSESLLVHVVQKERVS